MGAERIDPPGREGVFLSWAAGQPLNRRSTTEKAMKLLLFSDVHCSESHCRALVEKSSSVDIVVGAGDIGLVRQGLNRTISILKEIQKPTILVPGNSESREELEAACQDWQQAIVLHDTGVELMGHSFFGVGGGIPVTPFGAWSYDFTEEEAAHMLLNCPRSSILVTHSPPYGVVDLSSAGRRCGSRAIRRSIEENPPVLCVCGHIHESAGEQGCIDNTPIINAGPEGLVWELENEAA